MNTDDRRQSDLRIQNIERMVQEIHQRQNEVTIPTVNEIKNTLYSQGGICETVHEHSGSIKALDERVSKIPTVIGWIFTGVSVGAGAILWIIEHGRSLIAAGSK